MSICIICKEPYFRGNSFEPPEHCLCGEDAYGTLWQWDKHRAIYKRSKFIIAEILYKIANWLQT